MDCKMQRRWRGPRRQKTKGFVPLCQASREQPRGRSSAHKYHSSQEPVRVGRSDSSDRDPGWSGLREGGCREVWAASIPCAPRHVGARAGSGHMQNTGLPTAYKSHAIGLGGGLRRFFVLLFFCVFYDDPPLLWKEEKVMECGQ